MTTRRSLFALIAGALVAPKALLSVLHTAPPVSAALTSETAAWSAYTVRAAIPASAWRYLSNGVTPSAAKLKHVREASV